ncbi:MAG: hypothetical protein JWO90_774 [Solirubrobacterales bacterium]|jgi:hypothetical protein|nr:hypothetical protein [Solirubrobacterales bacterium]
MTHRRWLAAAAALVSLLAPSAAHAAGEDDRYALVHGCYDLVGAGAPVGPVRMQATRLGSYLLYTKDRRFVTAAGVAPLPSDAADFAVAGTNAKGFTLTARDGSKLARGSRLAFRAAQGCPEYPEVQDTSKGTPAKGLTPYSETRGYIDAHMHLMAYEYFGGKARCGRPWHAYGVPYALPDCNADPAAGAFNTVLETALGRGAPTDQVGWPTFNQWPAYDSLTHEASYWKWLERAWKSGLRTYVNLFVDNEQLCKVVAYRTNPCDDMESVRLQRKRIFELQDYIDAQYGGPGRGFFRIVTDPFEARRVANDGKLAVVLGIEVSRLFGCGLVNGVPQCDKAQIDRQLDEVHALGVRQMELVNKFDNAFGGVAGDSGSTGTVVNSGNRLETGRYWDMRSCDAEGPGVQDREQTTSGTPAQDQLFGAALTLGLPAGTAPIYPAAPHCNGYGLSPLGEHVVRRMLAKGMIVDPDHLGVQARKQLMTLVEAERYSGVVSSHTWSTPDAEQRILRLGGLVTPYAGSAVSFAAKWQELRAKKDPRWRTGFGYGADANGLGRQGPPRGASSGPPVTYPFKSFDGSVTFERQQSGTRTFDINKEGVAHYGLYADWFEDLRKIAGDGILADMATGSDSYLRTWERAVGIGQETCRDGRLRLTRAGMGQLRLGIPAEELLRSAGQPTTRKGRSWRWCVEDRGNAAERVRTAFTPGGSVALIGSTVARHRIAGVGPGSRTSAIRGARRLAPGVLVREAGGGRRYVYRSTAAGRVRWVAVATRTASRTPATLRSYAGIAGLR